jgi:hypothetical protein
MPYAEEIKGVADITSALIGTEPPKHQKDAFNEEVDFLGLNIDCKWSFC